MIFTTYLIPTFRISTFYKLPSEITQIIYYHIINTFAQKIINKWFHFVTIHNSNLCYIVNLFPKKQKNTYGNHIISYYDLQDKKLNIALSICVKYIKPSISDKNWWSHFIKTALNGFIFINKYDHITKKNIFYINEIYNIFEESKNPCEIPKDELFFKFRIILYYIF
jgi:hypothetical protein